MKEKEQRIVKVAKLRILKPLGDMTWSELGEMLRTVRYRVFRLAHLVVSEAYLSFHMFRTRRVTEFKAETMGKLSRRLREMLIKEGADEKDLNRYSQTGAVPDTVAGALSQYKIRGITSPTKWRQVIRGQVALPTFRNTMFIPVRCDKPYQRRLEQADSGDVEVELIICRKPYPRVVLGTGNLNPGQQAVLDRLLQNTDNSIDGYRQRLFETKEDIQTRRWRLYVTYDFPKTISELNPEIVVGFDLGYSLPLYVALNRGHARLGYRHFKALGERIKSLQKQVMAKRRAIQRGGSVNISHSTARSGHGGNTVGRDLDLRCA